MAQDYSFIPDKNVVNRLTNQSAFHYNTDNFKRVIDHNAKIFSHGYNIAGKLDITGSAANDLKWKVTSGVSGLEDEMDIERIAYVPSPVKLTLVSRNIKERGQLPLKLIQGEYPNGSLFAQLFKLKNGEIFSARVLEKEDGEWHGVEYPNEKVAPPDGYGRPYNCIDCHSDVGRASFEIDPKREWYGVVGVGSEKGGPIGFHPFDWKRVYAQPYITHKPTASAEVGHMFDYSAVSNIVNTNVRFKGRFTTATIKADDKNVIRIFSGKFCPPCRRQEKIMQSPAIQKELQRYEQHKYLDVKDGDKFSEYGVNVVPYLIIEKSGVSTRLVGLQTEQSILSALKQENKND